MVAVPQNGWFRMDNPIKIDGLEWTPPYNQIYLKPPTIQRKKQHNSDSSNRKIPKSQTPTEIIPFCTGSKFHITIV